MSDKVKKKKQKKWKPDKFLTTCCETIIFSSFEGEFVRCECGKTFVDQTEYFTKHAGNMTPISEEDMK